MLSSLLDCFSFHCHRFFSQCFCKRCFHKSFVKSWLVLPRLANCSKSLCFCNISWLDTTKSSDLSLFISSSLIPVIYSVAFSFLVFHFFCHSIYLSIDLSIYLSISRSPSCAFLPFAKFLNLSRPSLRSLHDHSQILSFLFSCFCKRSFFAKKTFKIH